MSDQESPFDDLTLEPEEDFNRALNDLIEAAHVNGIDTQGGWTIGGGDGSHDIGVEIYRVVRSSD